VAIELFQDAKDRLDRSEYRLSVIDARTALEVFVDEVLLEYFSASGTSLKEACQVLKVDQERANAGRRHATLPYEPQGRPCSEASPKP
jgi:hypothetical protein